MNTDPMCLVYGGVISFIVSLMKKVPLVKRFPKAVALVLSAASGILMAQMGVSPAEWKTIAKCVLEQFAAAVMTHEAVVQPAMKLAGKTDAEDGSGL